MDVKVLRELVFNGNSRAKSSLAQPIIWRNNFNSSSSQAGVVVVGSIVNCGTGSTVRYSLVGMKLLVESIVNCVIGGDARQSLVGMEVRCVGGGCCLTIIVDGREYVSWLYRARFEAILTYIGSILVGWLIPAGGAERMDFVVYFVQGKWQWWLRIFFVNEDALLAIVLVIVLCIWWYGGGWCVVECCSVTGSGVGHIGMRGIYGDGIVHRGDGGGVCSTVTGWVYTGTLVKCDT